MIIDSTGSNKITIGQTTEYKTTIDIENLDFIATLLSSNLYSNPEESFIREIVSNGWDSHVEANNTDTPIIVRIKRDANAYNGHDITIRDYGTGLSKEDFENLYCKIGSSTKRSSNDYLGMFGLGHLSPLSVSKVVYVTSYYDGIARFYIMTKDGNNITTNLMSETPTTEHNGLEITVKNQQSYKYDGALKDLMFFPNVYIDGYRPELNNIKIKRFKYFSASSQPVNKKILFGNVLYPLQDSIIPSDLSSFYTRFYNSGLVLNFNIGELTVTPNRESIIYNTKTNELIIQRLKDTIKEITDIINPHISKDFTNPFDYYNLIKGTSVFDFIENKLNCTTCAGLVFNKDTIPFKATLKGRDIDPAETYTIRKCESIIPKYRGVIVNDRVYTSEKITWDCRRVINDYKVKVIVIPSDQKLTCYAKSYLTSGNWRAVICGLHTYDDYKQEFLKNWSIQNSNEEFILKTCYEHFVTRCKSLDLNTDKDFLEFKENMRKDRKENKTTNVKDVILTIGRSDLCWCSPSKRRFSTYKDAVDYIKRLKGGILYRNLDAMQISEIATRLGYNVIGASKPVLKLLEQENFTHRITEDAINNHPEAIRFKTLSESKLHFSVYELPMSFIHTLPKEFKDEILLIKNSRVGKSNLMPYINTHIDNIHTDERLLNIYNVVHECYKEYKSLIDDLNVNVNDYTKDINDIISYIIMKNKLYKIGYDCYKQIKNNKIISRLCKK